jgi:hypothetical protein
MGKGRGGVLSAPNAIAFLACRAVLARVPLHAVRADVSPASRRAQAIDLLRFDARVSCSRPRPEEYNQQAARSLQVRLHERERC